MTSKITIHKPAGLPFNKNGRNKGWIAQFQMTPDQLYDWAPLMSQSAVAVDTPKGDKVSVYEDFDTFKKILYRDLVKNKVLDPSTQTKEYRDINSILSHKRRVENRVERYLEVVGLTDAPKPKSGITFFFHENDRDNPEKVPASVVLYVADEALYSVLPDDARSYYSTEGFAAVMLSNEQFVNNQDRLFESFEFSKAKRYYFQTENEIFNGSAVRKKSEFIAPRTDSDRFFIANQSSGEVFMASHRKVSGLQNEYGEGLALQEVQVIDGATSTALTYSQVNKDYRLANDAEVEHYKTQTLSKKGGFESQTGAAVTGSLVELIKSARQASEQESAPKVARNADGSKTLRLPEELKRYTDKDGSHVYRYLRADYIRALKMNPSLDMSGIDNTFISETFIWMDKASAGHLMEQLASTPNVNEQEKMLEPRVTEFAEKPHMEFARKTLFDPHFLQLNSLSPGATVNVDGREAEYDFFIRNMSPNDRVLRLTSRDSETRQLKATLMPASLLPSNGEIEIGGDTYKPANPHPGPRSIIEVSFSEGDKAWYHVNDFYARITAPTENLNPLHSSMVEKAFSSASSAKGVADSSDQEELSEVISVLARDLSNDENEVYRANLEARGLVQSNGKKASIVELENEGQMALFDTAEDVIKTHGRLVISKAEEMRNRSSEYLNQGDQAKDQELMPSMA